MFQQFVFDKLSVFLRHMYRDIETPSILDMDRYFPAHHDLKGNFKAIQAEAILGFETNPDVPRFHDVLSSQSRISANDGKNWRVFLVKSYGRLIQQNAAIAPELTAFLQTHPEVVTANISYLDPGKHIPPHKGPFRGILRYHICLSAPDSNSKNPPWLRVENEIVPYQEGDDLLWDDTYIHEVLNPGPNPRIALLLDVRRPVNRLVHKALYAMVLAGGWIFTALNEGRMSAVAPMKKNGSS